MELGFKDWKDILDVVIIPVVLGSIALLWPTIQDRYRRHVFLRLIKRELQEIEPYPEKKSNQKVWTEHLNKNFIHKKIIQSASDNREFILSLPPEIVYFVSQIWEAKNNKDGTQWIYYLGQLASNPKLTTPELINAKKKWSSLLEEYRSDQDTKC